MHQKLKSSYERVAPTGVVCSGCGQPVNRGVGKNDAALPVSMYACDCACFSSNDLVQFLPLTPSAWDVKRSARGDSVMDGCANTIDVSTETRSPDPVEAPPPKLTGTLVLYEGMRLAIAKCAEVDEAAGIKNKAAQLEAYARVRDDAESQRKFAEIRHRACQRIGQLSAELEKAAANQHTVLLPNDGKK